ncbi:hypothetical protein Scep_007934 [Stephania cephalantha]|uniref:Uncharacterized protein n=1 Tax=Stephania cephalantha TaxID=152367 RepID=A0AAP0KDG1_9MAGN
MRRLPPWHLRLRIREALRHPARESSSPSSRGAASSSSPNPNPHRKDLYVALTVCQMVETSSRVCCLAISSFFSFLSIKFEMFVVNVQAFDAFIGADFLGRFTRRGLGRKKPSQNLPAFALVFIFHYCKVKADLALSYLL